MSFGREGNEVLRSNEVCGWSYVVNKCQSLTAGIAGDPADKGANAGARQPIRSKGLLMTLVCRIASCQTCRPDHNLILYNKMIRILDQLAIDLLIVI